MKNAVVIKVNDLALCENFYRDVLKLGAPETHSSFATVFRLGEKSELWLIKTTAKFLEHGSSASSWSFSTGDMAALEESLEHAGYPLSDETFHLGCHLCRRGSDPENNPFYVMEENK